MRSFFYSWPAIAFFTLIFSACGDDSSSSTKPNDAYKVTVKDVVDSVICGENVSASIKSVNDSTFAIMCGADSVGYASASEYDKCDVSIHQDNQGVDFICDDSVVGTVNFKKENRSSSSAGDGETPESSESSSSLMESPDSSSSSGNTNSLSSAAESSSNQSDNGEPDGNESDEIKCESEVILPDPLSFMSDFSDCVVQHEDSFGQSETWVLRVSLNQEEIGELWNIQEFGFTPDKKHKNKKNSYVASGEKIAADRKYTIAFSLSNENGLYEGDVFFEQKDLTCEEFVSAHPGEYECLDNRVVEAENIGVCSDGKYDKKYDFCAADGIRDLCGTAEGYNIEFYDCMDDEVVLLYAFDETLDFLNQYITEVIGFEEDGDEFTSERWIAISNIDESSLETFRKILFAAGFGTTSQPNLYIIPKEDNEFGYSIEILPGEESTFYQLDIRKIMDEE